jgi:hypothetical protein
MVVPAIPPPPGCPYGWPIKSTAPSGMQMIWGAPHSRQAPGHIRLRGIGIKMRSIQVPGYPEHSESWAGLYQQKLHELFWRFQIFSQADAGMLDLILHLPMMGMPPREPTEEMMQEVRGGRPFTSFFKYATVIRAADIHITAEHTVHVEETLGSNNGDGDDVVIWLPVWPKASASADSLYRQTMDNIGFEFRTHLPEYDSGHELQNVNVTNLWFIQLLPNELPSYHFWVRPNDTPWILANNRKRIDGPGSPHFEDMGASYKQKMRLSFQNNKQSAPVAGGKRILSTPSANPVKTANPVKRRLSSSRSGSGPGPLNKKLKTLKPKVQGMGKSKFKGKGKTGSGKSQGPTKRKQP